VWADRVLHLIEDSSLCQRLGNAARSTVVEQFSLPRMVHQYKQLYESMLSTGARPSSR
jgi:glycosyltransferase involved in cell wall biosynthesis